MELKPHHLPIEAIRKMCREGKEWSEVSDWITRQVGYDREVILWANRIYNQEPRPLIDPSKVTFGPVETIPFDPDTMGPLITGLGEYREEGSDETRL